MIQIMNKLHLIRTFGRRHGKSLREHQQNLVDALLPRILADGKPHKMPVSVLEIGFGAGEHVAHIASINPAFHVIGAEPFMNGVASLLSRLEREHPDLINDERVKIWPDDVRLLLDKNPGIKFDLIYVLHPDPWPKARHEKRRLLQTEFLNKLADHLTPNGVIVVGTDHTDYFNWMLGTTSKSKLINIYKNTNAAPSSGLNTRYKNKNMFGSVRPHYAILALRGNLPSPEFLATLDLSLA